ncbi:SIS domain-containing protein [Veillonellaceae bacterium WCA-693-APC-5D-A]|uniref:Phosphoheptose isomerase n=1 Tax=Anaerovibrio slackiae TaxID=2652309 RepID=A0A6I2U7U8_9FIRM|nr:SIS domain-containing protein [Anaerovibrio slackiae]MSU07578.1 SIS domain-containing protein [Anaerovibrio slackiae]
MKEAWINNLLNAKHDLLNEIAKDGGYLDKVLAAAEVMTDAIKSGHKILLAGNGGSAADAQHFAGEIVGRFLVEREALPAISLCVDPSVMTCIGNDYGYNEVFARQLAGVGNEGDVFIGISTSGNSANIYRAMEIAKKKKIKTAGLLGRDGGKIKEIAGISLIVPSDSTPRIQEIHGFTVHLLCEIIERNIFAGEKKVHD